ncbi:Phosphatidylinositol N-acetylglucosaminyltransferase subunit P-like protein, partial [Drosera capensis]
IFYFKGFNVNAINKYRYGEHQSLTRASELGKSPAIPDRQSWSRFIRLSLPDSLVRMTDLCSVSSPRRTLSLSRKRRSSISFPEPDEKGSGLGVSGEHGPKPSEVYGFVGSITTVVATVMYFVWAYVPESWLHACGISYYPSRYWALAVPTYFMVVVVLVLAFYIGVNFMATPPPTSSTVMFDEYSREPQRWRPSAMDDDQPIEPISDLSISHINDLMFGDTQ